MNEMMVIFKLVLGSAMPCCPPHLAGRNPRPATSHVMIQPPVTVQCTGQGVCLFIIAVAASIQGPNLNLALELGALFASSKLELSTRLQWPLLVSQDKIPSIEEEGESKHTKQWGVAKLDLLNLLRSGLMIYLRWTQQPAIRQPGTVGA